MSDQPTFSSAVPAGGFPPAGGTPGRSSSRKTLLIAGGAAAAVVVAGGGAYAVQRLNGSSFLQPDEVLPGSAIGYVRVDLDPGMGQKLAAFRLIDKLPAMKDALGKGDPKKAIFEQLRKSSDSSLDYAKDIEPWLGDRFAVAVLPGEPGKLVPVTAVAVKDEAKAREGIDRLAAASRDKVKKLDDAQKGTSPFDPYEETVNVFRDGYMLTMPKSAEQKVISAIDAGSLAKKADYANDMSALGDAGIASAWYDPQALQAAMPQNEIPQAEALTALSKKAKPVASALRVGADYLEIVSNGAESGMLPTKSTVKDIATLPTDTVAVVSMSGAGDLVDALWQPLMDTAKKTSPDFDESLKQVEQATGLALPGDLKTLLGDQIDVVVPGQEFGAGTPVAGARLRTDLTKAEQILTKVESAMGPDSGLRIPRKVDGDKLILAIEQGDLGKVAGTGDLGSGALQVALPQLQDARSLFFVDLDKVEKYYRDEVPADYREAVGSLRAIGMSGVVKDGREIATLRLVVN